MKQGLQLKFGQNLTMTPQLQQAIRLLQLSSLELQQEIQEALENNPLLELPEEEHTPNWEQNLSAGISTSSGIAAEDDYIYQGETNESLQDYLLWQMRLSHFSETDEQIALIIIDAIDDSGYLTQSLDEVLEAAQQQDDEITGAEVAMVLKRIQNFEPIGVASRTVRECLLLQLEQLPKDTPALAATKNVVDNYLDLLGKHDYRTLARKSRLKEAVIRDVLALLQNLNPRPGDSFSSGDSNYVIPDIQVRKHQGRWIAELHPASAPRLRVNQTYAAMGSSKSNENCSSGDTEYIKQHLQEARWFIKSIESRNETLLKVAHCIVQRQQAFFEYGPESMKPMILSDVADSIDMHESTISRVTTQKFMHSPQGVFELKYFFSSHVSTDEGGEYSSTAIRALIRKLIAAENPGKPLSDNKLAQLLADQGIQVARRTIAKYRESLNIPPSSQRKSLL